MGVPGKNEEQPSSEPRFTRFAMRFEFGVVAAVLGATYVGVRAVDPGTSVMDAAAMALWVVLAIFAVVTTGLILLFRTSRGSKIAGALFAFALLMGTGALFSALFGTEASVLAMVAAAWTYYANPPVWAYDLIVGLGISGLAAAMGPPLTPDVVMAFMAILAVYDVVAVYGTRHMVRLAKVMLRRRVIFAMIVPEARRSLRARLDAVGSGKGYFFLGTGDLMLPALFVASVAARYGAVRALPTAIGTVLGYVGLNALFLKGRGEPMPALPPIAAGALLGYASSFLLQ